MPGQHIDGNLSPTRSGDAGNLGEPVSGSRYPLKAVNVKDNAVVVNQATGITGSNPKGLDGPQNHPPKDILTENPPNKAGTSNSSNFETKKTKPGGWTTVSTRNKTRKSWRQVDLKTAFPTMGSSLDEFITIKPTTNKLVTANRCAVLKDLQNATNISRDDISELRDGSLLIKSRSEERSKILKSLSKLGGCEVTISPHSRLNSSQGTIYAPQLHDKTEEDLCSIFKEWKVSSVYRFNKKINGIAMPTPRLLLTFQNLNLPENVYYAWLKFSVRIYIPSPRRCFQCQKFGHVGSKCHQQTRVCVYCGKPSHTPPACPNELFCINCGGNHAASSQSCSKFIYEKEVLSTHIFKKISIPDARRQIRSQFASDGVTFADVVRHTNSRSSKFSDLTQTPYNSSPIRNISMPSNHTSNVISPKVNPKRSAGKEQDVFSPIRVVNTPPRGRPTDVRRSSNVSTTPMDMEDTPEQHSNQTTVQVHSVPTSPLQIKTPPKNAHKVKQDGNSTILFSSLVPDFGEFMPDIQDKSVPSVSGQTCPEIEIECSPIITNTPEPTVKLKKLIRRDISMSPPKSNVLDTAIRNKNERRQGGRSLSHPYNDNKNTSIFTRIGPTPVLSQEDQSGIKDLDKLVILSRKTSSSRPES